ncbi:MAG: nickel insertion protein, partial [Leptolinea sp.]
MFLAALIDAGLSLDDLKSKLATLKLPDTWDINVEKVMKGAIQATSLGISIQNHVDTHHRHPQDIHDMIQGSGLSEKICKTSYAIFDLLAEAEAKVHGTTIEHVHFHEVGAVDSILDI